MTKTKTTKRALLMSALSLLLCVSMLVGTTFAWFTDSVTSGKNTIQSGNLDVELYYAKTANGPWDKVTATTDVFGYDNWEPGHTRVAYFKVANEGSLALKYQLTADVYNEQPGINKDGETFWLSDSLYTKVVEADATREDILAATDGVKLKSSIAMSGERSLLKGTSEVIGLAIWMPTTVGDEANHNGTNVPKIDFGINLVATQYTEESDSFDKLYDEGATYLNQDADGHWQINNANELAYFARTVNSGKTYKGETVELASDIDLAGITWVSINGFHGTFEGNGKTISNLTVNGTENVAFFSRVGNTAVIRNVTFDKATITGHHWVAVVLGYETNNNVNAQIRNVTVKNSSVVASVDATGDNGDKVGAIVGYATTVLIDGCTVENTTVQGYRDVGGILGYGAALSYGEKLTVTNNTVKSSKIICDSSCNYQGYTKADEYDVEPIVGQYTDYAVVSGNTATDVNVVVPQNVVSVGTAADLKQMLTALTSSGAGDNTINITSDIDIGNEHWEAVTVQGYTGADVITINGNGHTITGLDAPLFAGGFAGGSGVIINDLTIAEAEIVETTAYNATGVGAFICAIDSMDIITLNNCHLVNSSVTGSRTGGLVGWTSGYDNQNDGPVDTYVTIKNCSVVNCEITGYGTVGAINGHAGCNAATYTTIENCTVTGNTLISYDDSYRVGVVLGTANVGQVVIKNITESGNTLRQDNNGVEIARPAGQSNLYGRTAFGSTGSLTIDGVAVN